MEKNRIAVYRKLINYERKTGNHAIKMEDFVLLGWVVSLSIKLPTVEY